MEKINWRTEKRFIRDLVPLGDNPRKMTKHQAESLMKSFEKFNYVELIAINQDNTILAGHMRVAAMKKMGWAKKEIEVRVPDRPLSFQEAYEYCIRSNKNTGEWDWEELANSFSDLDLIQWGFTADELGKNFSDMEDEDDAEEEEEPECEKCMTCGQKMKVKNETKKRKTMPEV